MSNKGEEKQSQVPMIIALVVGGILSIGLFVVGIGMFSGGNKGPNSLGTQTAVAADLTDARTTSFIKSLEAATDPASFLRLNRGEIEQIILQLNDIENYWVTSKVVEGSNLDKAKEKIAAVRAALDKILVLLDGLNPTGTVDQIPSREEIDTLATTIRNNLRELSDLMSQVAGAGSGSRAEAVRIALALVERNQDGKGPIKYVSKMVPEMRRTQVKDGKYKGVDVVEAAKSMDCSGFVSYALVATGALDGRWSTEEFATSNLPRIDVDSNGDGIAQAEEIRKAVEEGKFLPGDVMISGLVNGHRRVGSTHAVMVASTDLDDPKSIIHSTNRGGKNGPQYSSWARRIGIMANKEIGNQVQFIRPNYR